MKVILTLLACIGIVGAQEPLVVTDQDRLFVQGIKELSIKLGTENQLLKDELIKAQASNISGLKEVVTKQGEVLRLNDDRNRHVKRADLAEDEVDDQKVIIKTLEGKVAGLKWILCSEVGIIAVLLCLWLGLYKAPGWGMWATIGAFPLAFAAAWAFF